MGKDFCLFIWPTYGVTYNVVVFCSKAHLTETRKINIYLYIILAPACGDERLESKEHSFAKKKTISLCQAVLGSFISSQNGLRGSWCPPPPQKKIAGLV